SIDLEPNRILSTTPLTYFTVDNDAHLATIEPLIRVDYAGNIAQFRHNDYDRAPLTHRSFEKASAFCKAHRKLLEVMRRFEMEFCTKLQVGEMIVVDNQRCAGMVHVLSRPTGGRVADEGEEAHRQAAAGGRSRAQRSPSTTR
ncbi:hypothetical protein BBJ28_00020431, partial [Nothophytophthora sp. Chile5]